MGLLKPVVELIVSRHGRTPWRGPVLTLGVQDVCATRTEVLESLARTGAAADPAARARLQEAPGAEKVSGHELFDLLGLGGCATLDKYAGEGASILHDLCDPVPPALRGAYGLVIDGGTLEHVFDIARAFENVIAMVRPGGSVLHVSPVAGWENHGFYSLNPKLLFKTYEANGFTDAEAHLLHVPRDGSAPWLSPCANDGAPFATDSARETLLLVFTATRPGESTPFAVPVDSHIAAEDRPAPLAARLKAAAAAVAGRVERLLAPSTPPPPAAPNPHLSALPEEELLLWKRDAEFEAVYARGSEVCGHPGPRDRYYVLKELLRSLGTLEADTAECGVYHGLGSYILLHYAAAMPKRERWRHHCYDSFEGLSEPTAPDAPTRDGVRAWNRGDMTAPFEAVQRNLAPYANVAYHRGWIPDGFRDSAELRFSLVHLDVDLYQPTRDALAFFYRRLLPGGVLICDDYGFLTCPGATRAVEEFMGGVEERLIRLPTGQAYFVKNR